MHHASSTFTREPPRQYRVDVDVLVKYLHDLHPAGQAMQLSSGGCEISRKDSAVLLNDQEFDDTKDPWTRSALALFTVGDFLTHRSCRNLKARPSG